jgi:DNA-binding transcriptional LysR family regulator
VAFFSSSHDRTYPFELMVEGQVRQFELAHWIAVNDAESYVACALRGCGLIQLPRYHVEDELREGRLVEVLSDWPSTGMVVSAMYPHHRQLSPRVRVFVDWVVSVYAKKFGSAE